jgi:predicted acyl esterase
MHAQDRPDTDFVAKLVDIWPDGTRMLVQDGIVRMRVRPIHLFVRPPARR